MLELYQNPWHEELTLALAVAFVEKAITFSLCS
jgi:hypothetical protein